MQHYTTYHYGDQGICDHGWGCSYRNAQTVASAMGQPVPTLPKMLCFFGLTAPAYGGGSRLWIEPPQVAKVLRAQCGIQSKTLVFAPSRGGLLAFERRRMLRSKLSDFDINIENNSMHLFEQLDQHFKETGGLPAIIDDGIYSFVLAPGRSKGHPQTYTLIDPHVGRGREGCVRAFWKNDLLLREGWMVLLPTQTKKKSNKMI